jgi:putative flippase GtrA
MLGHLKGTSTFLVVGGATAAFYYLLIYLFYGLFNTYYLVAVSIAYVTAVIFHFIANRNVTFGGRNGDTKIQIVKYAILAGLNYVVTLMVVALSVKYLILNIYVATALAILATLGIGYLGMKYWVFCAPQQTCGGIPPSNQ